MICFATFSCLQKVFRNEFSLSLHQVFRLHIPGLVLASASSAATVVVCIRLGPPPPPFPPLPPPTPQRDPRWSKQMGKEGKEEKRWHISSVCTVQGGWMVGPELSIIFFWEEGMFCQPRNKKNTASTVFYGYIGVIIWVCRMCSHGKRTWTNKGVRICTLELRPYIAIEGEIQFRRMMKPFLSFSLCLLLSPSKIARPSFCISPSPPGRQWFAQKNSDNYFVE